MGGASSYIAILGIAAFLALTWLATRVSQAVNVSSIVLEIATGVIFGPRVVGLISEEYAQCESKRHGKCDIIGDEWLGTEGKDYTSHNIVEAAKREDFGLTIRLVADKEGACDSWEHGHGHEGEKNHADKDTEAKEDNHADGHGRRLSGGGGGVNFKSAKECLEKSCEAHIAHECGLYPDFFTLIGHAGVALMIFESGMHFDFDKAKVVGPKACVVAVLGTILPLVSGMLLMGLFGKPLVPDGIAVGTALAPTSVGIALRLLGEAGVLQQDFGQAIITAAFVDDILSLILFNVLFSLRGEFDVMATVVFPIVGIAFMGAAMAAAVKFWPKAINDYILVWVKRRSKREGAKSTATDEALFFTMMAVLIVYATITHFLGTHLWGCFIAGMSFACIDQAGQEGHTHHVWTRQTKRLTSWMIRIFFACTVAFSIPIGQLMSVEALWKGSLMGIGPCILSKVICAPFMGDARWVIGWAMVGRAEFAYLIAQMAFAGDMIDEDTFSVAIWALLWATIFAPFVFRIVLNKYIARQSLVDAEAKLGEGGAGLPDDIDVIDVTSDQGSSWPREVHAS